MHFNLPMKSQLGVSSIQETGVHFHGKFSITYAEIGNSKSLYLCLDLHGL